ncbi:MAG TPA: hypothetical protein VLT16_17960 [Candidatus Limnocylindrales bacterium]|nr:hypothetical protein [Candidatus Limnocylindrales bacterium]
MSQQIPTYSFLPWLRTGVANSIAQADGDTGVKVRATLQLDVRLSAAQLDGTAATQLVHRDVSLFGPGDIVGIDARAIVKVDPRNWITNFEPNYLPYIEFYDEDFPWRYVPARADGSKHRLRPWIALVVLKETEFTEGKNMKGRPLHYFDLAGGIQAAKVFPLASELWAWAHVHINTDLSNNGDASMPGVLQRFEATLQDNPDRAYSRIMCPRRLEPDVMYHAFLIPSFETGRLAGLGQDVPDTTVATASAWDNNQTQFPYYYRWQFKTGDFGDFEYLVKLLKPRPVDKTVGVRDMDVLHPGSNLPKIDVPAELGGVLKLGGALRVPFDTLPPADKAEVTKYDQWDVPFPHPFETAMARRINLADDYAHKTPSAVNPDGDPDPVITSPLYGGWHALTNRLLEASDGSTLPNDQNWVHRLNLDPRFRVAAGFGTEVVQENDEQYMNAAWQQIGDVLEANNRIRLAQMAKAAALSWHKRHIVSLSSERVFLLTAPVHRRVLTEGITVAAQVSSSVVPAAVTSAPFRKVTRIGTPLMKRLDLPATSASQIVTRINSGEIHPAPPKVAPSGGISIGDAVNKASPGNEPPGIKDLLDRYPWLRFLPLLVLLIAVLLVFLLPVGAAVAVIAVVAPLMVGLFVLLSRWVAANQVANSIQEEQQTPASVDKLPTVPNFTVSRPGSGFTPSTGSTDSAEGQRFKTALRDVYTYTSIKFPEPVKRPLQLAALAKATVAAIHPAVTIPRRVLATIMLPQWLIDNMIEQFTPVMAYPVFDVPMYKPLADLSSELFLPHINLIPQNSMTLLESNQRFIESYMVGLNHEMARELLWREYPTDQRGSYFRQFWDVSLMLPVKPTPDDREKLRDIPEIHKWSLHSSLGDHNQRATHGQAALLVLVIRGELLKRYPTAVIYAQKSQWHRRDDHTIDVDAERELVELSPSEEDSLPPDKIRMPLFEAKIDPDIYFIGFDLTALEARGGTKATDDPGWFFVIKERPGEPRFGLDDVPEGETPRLINWNDLAWKHIDTPPGNLIQLSKTLHFDTYSPPLDQEDKPDPEDDQAKWNPNTNAADLAYILYRVPVLVAVHASRMLP